MARHGKMLMLIALAVSLLALTLASAEQCGSQAGNQKCPNNLCCSKYGYCGDTDEYCKDGCQSQCHGRGHGAYGVLAAAEQCGSQADNRKCPNSMCCSKYGYCGNTDEYCGEGCQSQCHSRGHGAYGALATAEQCGSQADNRKCPNGLCCSKFGYCGQTDEYCGDGCQSQCHSEVRALGRGLGAPQCGEQGGNRKCPNGLCCSQFGYCGDSDNYCGEGCQSQCPSDGGLRASTGKASYYSTYVPSACYGNDEGPFPRNRHMAAVSDGNPNLWKNGQGCGKHYRIRCQGNGCRNGDAITIKVVDRCPNGCEGRVLDLSEEAFGAIADKNAGVIKVQYEPVNSADAIPWAQKKLIAEVGRIRK